MPNVVTLFLYAISLVLVLIGCYGNMVDYQNYFIIIASCLTIFGSISYITYQSSQSEKMMIINDHQKSEADRVMHDIKDNIYKEMSQREGQMYAHIDSKTGEFDKKEQKLYTHIENAVRSTHQKH